MVLHIPIALPGSGKSTWARQMLPGCHVATDDIRMYMNAGEYVYKPEQQAEVFKIFHRMIKHFLERGNHVTADATNLRWDNRAPLLDIAEEVGAKISYIVFTNTSQAIVRNAEREGARRVPDESMMRFVGQYEKALSEVPWEPYDFITYIEKTG